MDTLQADTKRTADDTLRVRVHKLESLLEEKEKEKSNLEETIKSLQITLSQMTENEESKAKVHEASVAALENSWQQRVQNLEFQLQQVKTQNEEFRIQQENEKRETGKRILKLEAENSSLKENLRVANTLNLENTAVMETIKTENQKTVLTLEEQKRKLEEQLLSVNQRLQSDKDKSKDNNSKIEKDETNSNTLVAQEVTQLKVEIAKMTSSKASVEKRSQEIQETLKGKDEKIAEQTEKIRNLERQLQNLQEELQKVTNEAASTKNSLDSQISVLNSKIKVLQAAQEEKQTQLLISRNNITELQAAYDSKLIELEEVKKKNEQLEKGLLLNEKKPLATADETTQSDREKRLAINNQFLNDMLSQRKREKELLEAKLDEMAKKVLSLEKDLVLAKNQTQSMKMFATESIRMKANQTAQGNSIPNASAVKKRIQKKESFEKEGLALKVKDEEEDYSHLTPAFTQMLKSGFDQPIKQAASGNTSSSSPESISGTPSSMPATTSTPSSLATAITSPPASSSETSPPNKPSASIQALFANYDPATYNNSIKKGQLKKAAIFSQQGNKDKPN